MSRKRFLFTVFFISGFCGLLYQIVWLRMALAAFGVITPVISVIVSVFMLGLSVGSWLGGKWIARAAGRSGRSAIVYYGGIELMIGIGAFVVPFLFSFGENVLLGLGEAGSVTYLLCSAAAITIAILPWCIFMGATFPTMMAFVREFDGSEKSSFSFLYMANVLGAACGAALTAIGLVEMLGFSMTLRLGAALNMGIALACLLVGKEYSGRKPAVETSIAPYPVAPPHPGAPTARLTVIILFFTGFASMAMEVVWTRAFTPVMTTTIYAFASLLVTYLIATWLGSVKYRTDLGRGNTRPAGQLMGYLAAASFLPILLNDPRFHPNPFVVCMSIAPLCSLLGYLTPYLIDEYSSGQPDQAGKIYAVNILGCILGPLAAGYLLLPWIGVRPAMLLLGAPFVALFFMTFKSWADDHLQRNLAAGAAVVLLVLSIGWSKSLDDKEFYRNAEVRRDYAATVISDGEGMERRLLINGIGITILTPICKIMAHWPAVHLPGKPKNILVICFGMGTTFRSAMSWDADVYAAELIPSVRDSFGFYFKDAGTLLKNPKAHFNIDDGRRFLKRTQQKFDIITIDPPPPPEAAGSSLLYTEEFYDAIKARLSDDGILQQWYPLDAGGDIQLIGMTAARSIAKSFPYVRVFGSIEGWGLHFLASMKPIPARSADELAARIPAAAEADLVEWYGKGTTAKQIFGAMLTHEYNMSQVLLPNKNLDITDDRPFNEYYLLRRYFGYPYNSTLAPAVLAILVSGFIGALIVLRPRRTVDESRSIEWQP